MISVNLFWATYLISVPSGKLMINKMYIKAHLKSHEPIFSIPPTAVFSLRRE